VLDSIKTTDIAHTKYNNRGARYPTDAKKRYNDTSTKEKYMTPLIPLWYNLLKRIS
jgi:hypothetical protein